MGSPQDRAPYPYDFRITVGGTTYSLMLTRSSREGIGWEERRVNFFPQAPVAESIDYNRFPPDDEMVYVQDDFSGGVGQAVQPDGKPNRYAWAEHVDCTSGEASLVQTMTEYTTALATPTVGIPNGYTVPNAVRFGTSAVYFAVYRYLYKWNEPTSTLTQVLDAGAANVIGQLAVFTGTQSTSFLYVPIIVAATGKGDFYQTTSDGSTFTTSTNWKPTCFQVVGNELWGAFFETSNNTWSIRKTEAGTNGANNDTSTTFGAATVIGDPAYRIQWLGAAQNRLYVFKQDGLYAPSLDTTAVDEHLTPGWGAMATMKSTSSTATHGMGAVTFDDNLIFFFGTGLHRYDPLTGELEQFGPELLQLPFPLDRSFFPTDILLASYPGRGLFTVITVNIDSAIEHHIFQFGGYRRNAQGVLERVGVWHGSFAQFAQLSKPLCLFASPGDDYVHTLLILHNGTADSTKLSMSVLRLAGSPLSINDVWANSFYAESDAYLYLPRIHGYLPFETKLWSAIGIKGRNLYYTDASNYNVLAPEYKTTATPFVTTGYSAVNSTAATNEARSDPGKRVEASSNVAAQSIDVRINLKQAGSLTGGAESPVLSAVALVMKPRLAGIKDITAMIDLRDQVTLRDGSVSPNEWDELKTALERAGNADSSNLENTPLTVVTPFGESLTVFVKDFGVKIVDTDQAGDWQSVFFLRMSEIR